MNINEKDGKVIISLEGRIDSNNAAQIEKEVFDVFGANEDKEIAFDAGTAPWPKVMLVL